MPASASAVVPASLRHVGVVPLAAARLLELGHPDADDEHLAGPMAAPPVLPGPAPPEQGEG